MSPNEVATVPTEAAILHDFRSTTDPYHSRTASLNSTATSVSAETPIDTASSKVDLDAPPTLCNRVAERSAPDSTIEVGIEQRHLDTYTAGPATGATTDHHIRIFVPLMSSNDEVERRGDAAP
jgi:hypothetical protein